MPLTHVCDALPKALVDHGPESRVYRHIEHVFATCTADLVDYEALVESDRRGELAEPPPLAQVVMEPIAALMAAVKDLAKELAKHGE